MIIVVLFPKYFQSSSLACGRISICTLEVRRGHGTLFGKLEIGTCHHNDSHVDEKEEIWLF